MPKNQWGLEFKYKGKWRMTDAVGHDTPSSIVNDSILVLSSLALNAKVVISLTYLFEFFNTCPELLGAFHFATKNN